VIERCFSSHIKNTAWQQKMKSLVPSYGESLIEDAALLKSVRERTLKTLNFL
jgi:malate dehydrogenase (quinone)